MEIIKRNIEDDSLEDEIFGTFDPRYYAMMIRDYNDGWRDVGLQQSQGRIYVSKRFESRHDDIAETVMVKIDDNDRVFILK